MEIHIIRIQLLEFEGSHICIFLVVIRMRIEKYLLLL